MALRLIDFCGAALVFALSDAFLCFGMTPKRSRAAPILLLSALHTLLLTPSLLWGMHWILVSCALLLLSQYIVGIRLLVEPKHMIVLTVLNVAIIGVGDVLFMNVAHATARAAWPDMDAAALSLLKNAALILVVAAYYIFVYFHCVKVAKEQLQAFASMKMIRQFAVIFTGFTAFVVAVAYYCARTAEREPSKGPALLAVSFAFLTLATFLDYAVFRMVTELAGRKEIELKLKYKELESQLLTNYSMFLRGNAERLSAYKHDTNNVLQTLRRMLPDGQAAALLDAVSESINSLSVTRYTQNELLNALLFNKNEEARQRGVVLELQIALPEETGIPDLALLRAFSNLLDNAIRAAAALPDPAARRAEITCRENAGYLYVSTRNPLPPPASQDEGEAHEGLGLSILQGIAREHGGSFVTQQRDGMWLSLLALRISC